MGQPGPFGFATLAAMARSEVWWRSALAARVATAAVLLGGCADHDYVGEDPLYQFAITESTPAFFVGEDESFFLVEERIELTLEPPTDADMASLNAEAPAPFPRRPWAEQGDYALEIDWALINLDDQAHRVLVRFNGINEFNEYVPGVSEGEEEILPDLSQWERTIELGPFERRSGTVREAELEEVAVDLATVVNGAPNANQIVHPDNHSSSDVRSQLYIPAVIPALVGVRAGLGVMGEGVEGPEGAGAGANVVMELTIRVRDEDDKITDPEDAWMLPVPVPFMPPPAEL
ncbi:MAG: hypothetical protein CMN30_01100 [Sandaracinus sp.]|nr:hypothetical protein [Sandaracinus sp.]|tara:strand:- start:1858 stop:2727 length:870 start_codon:yes stop_codon:yes gene_type:complete